MAKESFNDIEFALNRIPSIWTRGALLVFTSTALEALRKIILIKGYIPSNSLVSNAFLGIELFIAMIGGLDLFRTYTVLSWIYGLMSESILLKTNPSISASKDGYSLIVNGVASRNIVEGVLLTSLTFIGGIGVILGITLRVNKLARIAGIEELNTLRCYFTVMTACKAHLNRFFSLLINKINRYYSVGEELAGDGAQYSHSLIP